MMTDSLIMSRCLAPCLCDLGTLKYKNFSTTMDEMMLSVTPIYYNEDQSPIIIQKRL